MFSRENGENGPASEVKMFTVDLNMSLMLGGAVISAVASQHQGLWFESPGDQGGVLFYVCMLSAWLLSGCPGLLPRSKDTHLRGEPVLLNGRLDACFSVMSWGHVQPVL